MPNSGRRDLLREVEVCIRGNGSRLAVAADGAAGRVDVFDDLVSVRRALFGARIVSVALSADGSTLAAGRSGGRGNVAGRVHVYDVDDDDALTVLLSREKLNNAFGCAVALNEDGTILAVGAPQEGNRRGYATILARSS